MPTEIWCLQLRPGSAHGDLEFAVEIWSSREGGREGGRKEVTLIKSRDPHLAGGEKKHIPLTTFETYFRLPPQESLRLASMETRARHAFGSTWDAAIRGRCGRCKGTKNSGRSLLGVQRRRCIPAIAV